MRVEIRLIDEGVVVFVSQNDAFESSKYAFDVSPQYRKGKKHLIGFKFVPEIREIETNDENSLDTPNPPTTMMP